MTSILLRIACTATLLFISVSQANEITKYWSTYNNDNTDVIDHSSWDTFLKKYLNTQKDHKISYGNVSAQSKAELDTYINMLSELNPHNYNKAEQFAYWVNLYNALTVQIVIEHYPVKSIRKIKLGGGVFAHGPWKAEVLTINQQKISLDIIEHSILRPICKDPRIHYAVNCASVGCPNLASQAFTANTTEQLLEANSRAFINSDKGVSVRDGSLTLSKIYYWYKEDFDNNEHTLVEHLKHYAEYDTKQLLNTQLPIRYQYNWELNDTQ